MGTRRVVEAPDCYGDSDEYSETGSACRACPFSSDCANAIRQSVNKISIREAKSSMVQPRRYSSYSSSSTSTAKAPTTSGNAIIRPAKFNHNKPIVAQYVTYVAFDVAEAITVRATDLVRSCRSEYERELHEKTNGNS